MLKYVYVIVGWMPRASVHAGAGDSAASAGCAGRARSRSRSGGTVDVVEVALLEREQPRIALLDDADLDAPDQRQLLAAQPRDDRAVGGIRAVADRRTSRKPGFASSTIFCPRRHSLSRYGPGADGIRHRPAARVAVGLDHLARDRGGRRRRQVGQQVVRRRDQPDARSCSGRSPAGPRAARRSRTCRSPSPWRPARRRRRTCRRTAADSASASSDRARASIEYT